MMKNKLHAVIVDDEKLGRNLVREFLASHKDIRIVAECKDAHEALAAIEKHTPELLFLDIQMPEINGFELLNMLDELPYVIFSTAYDQYAVQAFEVNAVDYLLKPYVQARFDKAIERARVSMQENHPQHKKVEALISSLNKKKEFKSRFLIKQSGKIFVIQTQAIQWITAADDYVNLHTQEGDFLVLQSMIKMEAALDPQQFVRVHRSTIVNLEAISELHTWTNGRLICRMKDGEEIVTSRAGAKRLKELML